MRRDDDVEEDVRTSAFSEGEGYEETEDSTEDLEDEDLEDEEDDNTAVRQAWGELPNRS